MLAGTIKKMRAVFYTDKKVYFLEEISIRKDIGLRRMKRGCGFVGQIFNISTEYITLGQLLKETGVIDTGGMAKWFLAEHEVFVNDELENRRGKKLYPGDEVRLSEQMSFTIVSA